MNKRVVNLVSGVVFFSPDVVLLSLAITKHDSVYAACGTSFIFCSIAWFGASQVTFNQLIAAQDKSVTRNFFHVVTVSSSARISFPSAICALTLMFPMASGYFSSHTLHQQLFYWFVLTLESSWFARSLISGTIRTTGSIVVIKGLFRNKRFPVGEFRRVVVVDSGRFIKKASVVIQTENGEIAIPGFFQLFSSAKGWEATMKMKLLLRGLEQVLLKKSA